MRVFRCGATQRCRRWGKAIRSWFSGPSPLILHLAIGIDNRLGAGTHDAVGARPDVAGDDHATTRMNIADAQQIPKHSFDIDISFEVGDIFDQAAQTAGAKDQQVRGIIENRNRGASCWFGQCFLLCKSPVASQSSAIGTVDRPLINFSPLMLFLFLSGGGHSLA